MSGDYLFRQAAESDLNLLVNWTMDLMAHEALDNDLEIPLKSDIKTRIEQWINSLLKSDNALYIIADDSAGIPCGCILGIMQLAPNDFTEFTIQGLIQMVWVDESQRRNKLADQLVNHMEDTFKNLDIPYCEISFSISNQEAKGFWLTKGYQPVSQNCRKIL